MYDEARQVEELNLLRTAFPDLEVSDDGDRTWVRLPDYSVPAGWTATSVEIAFCFPAEVGQPPYAFYVRPALELASGAIPGSYTQPATTPWGADFGQFSWAPQEPWVPRSEARAGANMLNFAQSFAVRLQDPS